MRKMWTCHSLTQAGIRWTKMYWPPTTVLRLGIQWWEIMLYVLRKLIIKHNVTLQDIQWKRYNTRINFTDQYNDWGRHYWCYYWKPKTQKSQLAKGQTHQDKDPNADAISGAEIYMYLGLVWWEELRVEFRQKNTGWMTKKKCWHAWLDKWNKMWDVGGTNSEDTADDFPHCILRQSYLPPISVRLGLTEYGRFWSLLFTVSFLWDAAFSQQSDKSTDTINPDYIHC